MSTTPTTDDRAIIDWQRSDDGGASWRVDRALLPERSELHCPSARDRTWRPWGVRHGFIGNGRRPGRADSRARLLHAAGANAAACLRHGPATRINVLQQSALPTIVERAALRAGPHRPDRQLVGDGLRPARPHAAVADPPRQFDRRLEQCHHRHRRHCR